MRRRDSKRFWGKREGFFGGVWVSSWGGQFFWAWKRCGNSAIFRPLQMPVEMEAFYVAAKLSSTFCRPTSTKKSQKSQKSQLILRERQRLYITLLLIIYVIIDIYSVKTLFTFFRLWHLWFCDNYKSMPYSWHIHSTARGGRSLVLGLTPNRASALRFLESQR